MFFFNLKRDNSINSPADFMKRVQAINADKYRCQVGDIGRQLVSRVDFSSKRSGPVRLALLNPYELGVVPNRSLPYTEMCEQAQFFGVHNCSAENILRAYLQVWDWFRNERLYFGMDPIPDFELTPSFFVMDNGEHIGSWLGGSSAVRPVKMVSVDQFRGAIFEVD